MPSRTSRRGLSTARAALQVAWLLVARPEGIRADDVAEQLGKSVSTAYNLLVSLCDEGVAVHHSGGLYRLAPAFAEMVTSAAAAPADELHDLSGVVAELLARTHKRSYLGVLRAGELHVVAERGAQGMAKLPGLGAHIADNAHALALGKVMLAMAPPEVVERYLQAGLRRFSAHTITEPDALRDELREVRRRGFAVDREEFDEDFCCIGGAGPRPPRAVARGDRDLDDAPGLRRRARDARADRRRRRPGGRRARPRGRRSHLSAYDIARFQASSEIPPVLDRTAEAGLAWARATTVP